MEKLKPIKKIKLKMKELKPKQMILYCCVGIFILACLGAIISPDNGNNTINTDQIGEPVVEEKPIRIDATEGDMVTYRGYDYAVNKDYQFSIVVDNQTYYISKDIGKALAKYSPNFKMMMGYDCGYGDIYPTSKQLKAYFSLKAEDYNGPEGTGYYIRSTKKLKEDIIFPNDKNFSFEFENGKKMGVDKLDDSNIITKVYYPNGTELRA